MKIVCECFYFKQGSMVESRLNDTPCMNIFEMKIKKKYYNHANVTDQYFKFDARAYLVPLVSSQ